MARTIGEIIKELRKQRKITQEELAQLNFNVSMQNMFCV
jgi:transcriptional regulator with XRE-family HTH domain